MDDIFKLKLLATHNSCKTVKWKLKNHALNGYSFLTFASNYTAATCWLSLLNRIVRHADSLYSMLL